MNETYQASYQTFMMGRFGKMINGQKPLTIFTKRLHNRCLGVLKTTLSDTIIVSQNN